LEQGYEFVIGVANANSTPGFLKNLKFTLICPLKVKFGAGSHTPVLDGKYEYSRFWDKKMLVWRLSNPKLQYEIVKRKDHFVVMSPTGKYGIRAVLGTFPLSLFPDNIASKSRGGLNPVNIWMGLDENLSWKGKLYFDFPDKLKPSPLNLIFRDLTGKNRIPKPEQIRFMSLDFDAY
jgi:hypothetical protein